jgi:hypothetical protein
MHKPNRISGRTMQIVRLRSKRKPHTYTHTHTHTPSGISTHENISKASVCNFATPRLWHVQNHFHVPLTFLHDGAVLAVDWGMQTPQRSNICNTKSNPSFLVPPPNPLSKVLVSSRATGGATP